MIYVVIEISIDDIKQWEETCVWNTITILWVSSLK